MSIHNFFKPLISTSTRHPPLRRNPLASRLSVGHLEDRTVPAFLAPVDYRVAGAPQTVVTGDFNNDTLLDLAVGSGNAVSVLLGNGDGTFRAAVTSGVSFPDSLASGDFNTDGVLDLATTNHDAVNVLLGNGDGSFRPPGYLSIGSDSSPRSVAAGDFTGDGNLDLEVLSNVFAVDENNPDDPGHYEGRVKVLPGDGAGSFAAPVASALGSGYLTDAAVADFDDDGKDDLAATDSYSTLRVFLSKSDGSGNLLASAAYTTGTYLQSVLVADVNGDGIGDLVTGNGGGVSVLLGNGSAGVGDGTFRAAQTTALGFYSTSLTVGDFNADGNLDLGAANNIFVVDYTNPDDPDDYYGHYECEAKVLLGNDNGQFAAAETTEFGVGISDVTRSEGKRNQTTQFTFTVTLSAAYDRAVTMSFKTTDGTAKTSDQDYVARTGTITFAPGETTKTVTIEVKGDSKKEADEYFYLDLFGNSSNSLFKKNRGTGTTLNDD